MINHARTLLMNRADNDFDRIGEEIVDPTFRPLSDTEMPSGAIAIRRVLFGPEPDAEMLNYRCRQLLVLVHATELADYLLALDPRVTYDLADTQLGDDALFLPVVREYVPTSANVRLSYIDGFGTAPDTSGVLRTGWNLSIVSVNSGPLRTRISAQPMGSNVHVGAEYHDLNLTAGYSTPAFTLAGTTLRLRVNWLADPLTNADGTWHLWLRTRPQRTIPELETALQGLGTPVLDIFGVGTAVGASEPYVTLWRLWREHPISAYRMASLVVALVYQMNRVRA